MSRFHINPDTGESGVCSAKNGQCPFGEANHFDSHEEAQLAGEDLLGSQHGLKTVRKKTSVINRQDVVSLIDELYTAADNYYHRGVESHLTDEEFDAKLEYLQILSDSGEHADLFDDGTKGFKLLENDPSLGTTVDGDTVPHAIPMLSLAKAKKEPELMSYLTKTRAAGAKDFRLQAKLDGLAMSAEYLDGKLKRLSTRGDGQNGEDATYTIRDPKVKIKGLESTISELGKLEVRGELFFTKAQFEKADAARFAQTGQHFKNSRNAATGLMKAAKLGVEYPVEFTFATYSVIRDDSPASLDLVNGLGFETVDELTERATNGLSLSGFKSDSDVMDAVHDFGRARENFDFPTDGVVIKPTNEAELLSSMGYTSHHPVSEIAWKYPDAKATTEILAIDVTVGRSGKLTPIARVKPVDLDGSTISNASLHNYNLVRSKGIRVGSIVLVEKANMIIPQVVAVLSSPENSVETEVPKFCPSCKTTLDYDKQDSEWPPKTLRCPNPDCDSRMTFALRTAVTKTMLDIDGMSESSLDYLTSVGRVTTIADLYTLTLEELADSQLGESQNGNARRLGERRAQNILNHIEKSKEIPLTRILPALSIELLGKSASKALEKRFGDIDGILAATKEEIAQLDGLGVIKAEKIHEGLQRRKSLIETMRKRGVLFTPSVAPAKSTSSPLSGKSFSISGAVPPGYGNRNQWVEYIESQGAEFHSSPKAHTNFMIGDPTENSSKVQAARKLGLPFMSPSDFAAKFPKS